jgi:hypothetical protein
MVSCPEVSLRSASIHTYSHTRRFRKMICVISSPCAAAIMIAGGRTRPRSSHFTADVAGACTTLFSLSNGGPFMFGYTTKRRRRPEALRRLFERSARVRPLPKRAAAPCRRLSTLRPPRDPAHEIRHQLWRRLQNPLAIAPPFVFPPHERRAAFG